MIPSVTFLSLSAPSTSNPIELEVMQGILTPTDWIPFPQHPEVWFGLNIENVDNSSKIGMEISGFPIPWETTQLNLTQNNTFDYTYIHPVDPPQFLPFDFEIYDWKSWGTYGTLNWHLPFVGGFFYLIVIFGIQHFMKNREPFSLKWPLFAWNSALGVFSIIGFIRVTPEFVSILLGQNGLYKGMCFRDGGNFPLGFWSLLFVLSKYVELGDTVFIVLRKRPLVFLQWYHHLVTLVMAWLSAPYIEPIARWYVVMNYGVHSMMYPYFALRTAGYKFPWIVSVFITTCQLSQMLLGLFVNLFTALLIRFGTPCYRHPFSIRLSVFVYGSFTILFGKLFYDIIRQRSEKKGKIE